MNEPLPELMHCRTCETVFPRRRTRAHTIICRGGTELHFPATRDHIAAYAAILLAETVEQERIAAGPVPPPPKKRRRHGTNTSRIAAGA